MMRYLMVEGRLGRTTTTEESLVRCSLTPASTERSETQKWRTPLVVGLCQAPIFPPPARTAASLRRQ